MPTTSNSPLLRQIRLFAGANNSLTDRQLLERFVRFQDSDAFGDLVRRHGPMVLGLCRRILADSNDADDAFQATFIVLVRKADRLKQPELLGNWLFGVAQRIALKAKARSNDRRSRYRPLADDDLIDPNCDACGRCLPILDEAIARLPTKYRAPIVLCYLQGRSHAESAQQLGCATATIATRLARAKARLRASLIRQGLTPAIATAALAVSSESLTAAVPLTLACGLRANSISILAGSTAATVPLSILSLTKGLGPTMFISPWKANCVVFLTLAAAGAGIGYSQLPAAGERPIQKPLEVRAFALPLEVTHEEPGRPTANEVQKPPVCATENFFVTAPSSRIARLVAHAAEDCRRRLAMEWLGKELPSWPRQCPITLRLQSQGSGGATKMNFDFKGGVEIIGMELSGSLEQILASALPHEVTHAVLATHFAKPLPRWADEGAATLAEDADEQAQHDEMMLKMLEKKNQYPLRQLFDLREYHEAPNALVVYVQGNSIVRFLVNRRDKPTFVTFIARGLVDGWDQAARDLYEFRSVETLELAWLKDLQAHRAGAGDSKSGPAQIKPQAPLPTLDFSVDKDQMIEINGEKLRAVAYRVKLDPAKGELILEGRGNGHAFVERRTAGQPATVIKANRIRYSISSGSFLTSSSSGSMEYKP